MFAQIVDPQQNKNHGPAKSPIRQFIIEGAKQVCHSYTHQNQASPNSAVALLFFILRHYFFHFFSKIFIHTFDIYGYKIHLYHLNRESKVGE